MKEHFKEKFSSRTKEELLVIVNNRTNYQFPAVEAAVELLVAYHDFNPEELETTNPQIENHNPRYVKKSQHLKPAYFRTFSSREAWSSLSAAAAFLAIMWIFRDIDMGEANDWVLFPGLFALYLLSNVLNHLFYMKEHKRSLPFLAGFFQLSLTTTWILIFLAIRSITLPTVSLTFEEIPMIYLVMLFLALIAEALTQFIKAIFIVFKWRIW